KVTLLSTGNTGIVVPSSVSRSAGAAGHVAPPVVAEQVTTQLLRPDSGRSITDAPSAASGPSLLATMVDVVWLPPGTGASPWSSGPASGVLVLLMRKSAPSVRVLTKVQVRSSPAAATIVKSVPLPLGSCPPASALVHAYVDA